MNKNEKIVSVCSYFYSIFFVFLSTFLFNTYEHQNKNCANKKIAKQRTNIHNYIITLTATREEIKRRYDMIAEKSKSERLRE